MNCLLQGKRLFLLLGISFCISAPVHAQTPPSPVHDQYIADGPQMPGLTLGTDDAPDVISDSDSYNGPPAAIRVGDMRCLIPPTASTDVDATDSGVVLTIRDPKDQPVVVSFSGDPNSILDTIRQELHAPWYEAIFAKSLLEHGKAAAAEPYFCSTKCCRTSDSSRLEKYRLPANAKCNPGSKI
jgi:hypothetical protein